MEYLLPCTEDWFAGSNGHRQRGPQQRCLKMRMAVAVVPGLLVAVAAAGWDELVQNLREILLQARLELDCANCRRASNIKDIHCTGLNARCSYDFSHASGE